MELSRQASPIIQKIMEQNFTAVEPDAELTEAALTVNPEEMTPEPEPDMGALMEQYDHTTQRGQIINARVVGPTKDGVMVDIGTKSDGFVPNQELDPSDELQPGDEIEVLVLKPETEEGTALLSKRRADYEKNWRQLLEAFENGQVLDGLVKDSVKGGLVVDLGVEGFIPASQVATKKRDLSVFIGQILKFKIIDIDRKRNKLILSNRLAVDEEREKKKVETWGRLDEGNIVGGVVRRLTDFGAFVDIGGVDGLLHVTDIAWTRLKHPSDVLKVGQKVDVLILEINRESEKVSLGLKQLLPDPWKKAARNYRTGKVVKGIVTRIVPSGAFVHLEEGIEGIIPVSEISDRHVASPDEVVHVGQEVEVKVLQVRAKQRRMSLSLKDAEREKEKREYRDFMSNQKMETVTLGDVFGQLLNNSTGTSDVPVTGDGEVGENAVGAGDSTVSASLEDVDDVSQSEDGSQPDGAVEEVEQVADPAIENREQESMSDEQPSTGPCESLD